jgi:glycine betaine catabolism B
MGDWMVDYIGKRDRATGVKTFTLERPADLDYRPGQFFFINIPGEPGMWMEHHFSFSSSPTEAVVEFTTRMTGHEFKQRMDALEPGTAVRLSGPQGNFVLQPEVRKAAYVCGGIGITPARSTVRWALDAGPDIDIVLLRAERDMAGSAFGEEFSAIRSATVRVVNVLSSPEPGWTGRTGRIDATVVREEVPDWSERSFFVSGSLPMVTAIRSMLVGEVGVAPDRIKTEEFPGYGPPEMPRARTQ